MEYSALYRIQVVLEAKLTNDSEEEVAREHSIPVEVLHKWIFTIMS